MEAEDGMDPSHSTWNPYHRSEQVIMSLCWQAEIGSDNRCVINQADSLRIWTSLRNLHSVVYCCINRLFNDYVSNFFSRKTYSRRVSKQDSMEPKLAWIIFWGNNFLRRLFLNLLPSARKHILTLGFFSASWMSASSAGPSPTGWSSWPAGCWGDAWRASGPSRPPRRRPSQRRRAPRGWQQLWSHHWRKCLWRLNISWALPWL
mgnify:CR=1 FL=1